MRSAIAEAPTMTSEQASRFLRSKTEDIGPLIDFAHGLIDERYANLYFPRKEEFLMDWWFDRAEIGTKNEDYWKLFKTIWASLDTESQRQIYHRHKFLDTIKSTLGWIASEVAANDDRNKERLAMLNSVFNSVECVEQANIWLRCPTDVMMSIVIDYLKIVSVIPDAAMESWYRLIFVIYENALYGVSNFKKISQSFSDRGLLASFTVLKEVDSQTRLHEKLSNILRDLVFSPSVIKGNENQPFKDLCDALSQIPGVKQDGAFLGHVLSLGLSKFGKTKQQAFMPKMCEEFLNFAPQTAQYILRQAKDHDITISSEMLTKALLIQQPIDWNLATIVLDVAADAVFPLVEGLMDDQLRNSDKSPEIVGFVCQVAEAYTKIRNLPRFINIWRNTLAEGVRETSVLISEDLVRAVATQISGNWTIHQLHSIFEEIIPKDETDDLIEGDLLPLIAITIGASLLQDPLPDWLLLKAERLYSLLDAKPLQKNYLTWRLKYLILSMHKTIVKSVIKSSYTEASDIASAVKSLVNPDKRIKDRRISYFKFQILFRMAEFQSWTGFSPVAQWLLDIMDRKSYSSWDQDIAHIGKENLSTALAYCITNRWLVLVE
ncbi:uncharacterized protein V1513DRAFT_382519 [Lipomyces chichibuensis]|uniref:uncharacterized protein n=1 Tax=Lipomyces chichibuensis TaxID=1546026 RepID=UPI0033431052